MNRTPPTDDTADLPPARPTVRTVVREVVADVSPEEVPLVDALAASGDDDTVVRLLRHRRRRTEQLGFGLEQVAVLVTPVVWLILDEVVQQSVGAAVSGTGRATWRGLRRLFRRGSGGSPQVPPLTPEQARLVGQRVRDRALAAGMEPDRADALADAVLVRLLLDPTHGADGRTLEHGSTGSTGEGTGRRDDATTPER